MTAGEIPRVLDAWRKPLLLGRCDQLQQLLDRPAHDPIHISGMARSEASGSMSGALQDLPDTAQGGSAIPRGGIMIEPEPGFPPEPLMT